MGAYAGPYIPGVDVAVGGGCDGFVAAPRLHSRLQLSSASRLEAMGHAHERHESQHAQEVGASSECVSFRRVAAARAIP